MADTNIAVISSLVSAECFVDALVSVDPVITFGDKTPTGDFYNRSYDTGVTVNIKVEDQPQLPAQATAMQISPVNQQEIALTCLPYNDGIPLPDIEYEYFLGGEKRLEKLFHSRMQSIAIQPAIQSYDVLGAAMNFVGTPGSDLKTTADWGAARAILADQLAMDGYVAAVSPRLMGNVAGDIATLFNPQSVSSAAQEDGRIKRVAGFKMYESTILPVHTNGSAVGNGTSGMAVATNVTTGATTVAVSGGTSAGVISANSGIWFSGCLAVQPHTKKTLATKRYFNTVGSVTLSGGAGTLTVSEPIYGPENLKLQNISALPTTSSFVGIFGAASTTYEQTFFFKEDSFAVVGLKRPEIFALKNTFKDFEGINIRTCSFGDGFNSASYTRWDILSGACKKQWRHMGRAFTAVIS